jgi:tetratricopeptide (TPR) repeat protein/photosystem II stability/assembly factor-like uncharacterized protein
VITSDNRFVIYLMKLWLQKNRPLEQVREELTEVNPIANRYIEIGLEFKDAQMYDRAVESFREALNVARDNVQAQVNIALTYMDQKAYSSAVVEFEKALTMDDEDVSARAGLCEALLSLGDTAMTRGRAKEAVQSYQRVLAINAEHTEARQRMADLSRRSAEKALVDGKDEEALSAFAEALKFTPEDPALIARVDAVRAEKKAKVLAALLAKSGKEAGAKNWEGAIKSLDEALSFAPEDMSIQKKLSEVKAAQEKARLDALLAKADTAARSGRWNEAIEAYSAVIAAQPDEKIIARLEEVRAKQLAAQLNTLRTQARALAKAEKFDEALKVWQEVLSLAPSEETAAAEMEVVGNAQALAKSYAEAQKAYVRKNYDQAVSLLKGIINQDENYKDASRLLAESIQLRRTARKWWQSKWLWGAVASSVVLVVAWLAFRPDSLLMSALFAPTAAPITNDAPGTVAPNVAPATATALVPPTLTPTPLPLSWARLNSGQFLPRDQITDIVIDSKDPGVLYVGTQNAGVYKSIDGGLSWQPMQNGLGRAVIKSLVIDPQNPDVLYAGTSLGGVYTSIDKANSWFAVNNGIDTWGWEWVSIVILDPTNSQHLYYTHSDSVYESTNGGANWSKVWRGRSGDGRCPGTIVSLVVNPLNPKLLFAADWGSELCTPGGIYQSDDGGTSWTRLDLELPYAGFWQLSQDSQDGTHLYVYDSNNVFYSSDRGQTWQLPISPGCFSLKVYPEINTTAYCGRGDGLWVTRNSGANWEQAHVQKGDAERAVWEQPWTVFISPQSSQTILVGGAGLWLTEDGGISGETRNSGLGSLQMELSIDPFSSALLLDNSNNCQGFRSDDSGRTWSEPLKDWTCAARRAYDPSGYSLSLRGSQLYRSNDGSQKWSSLPLPGGDKVFPNSIATHPNIPGRLYVLYGRDYPPYLFLSNDNGETWSPSTGMGTIAGGVLFFAGPDGQRMYAIGDLDFYRSADAGEAWNACGNPSDSLPSGSVWTASAASRMFVDPRDPDHLVMVSRGAGLLVSQDGCNSWQPSNTGIGSLFANSIAADPNNPDTLYAGTDGGVYISYDGGKTWGQANDGLLGATVVYSIVVDKDSNVYAATPYGIFKLEGK